MSKAASQDSGKKVIAQNKRARFDYHIIECFEAGIVLTGAEIKSVRQGDVSLNGSYVFPRGAALYLQAAHIKPYAFDANKTYDPLRDRKLLLHGHELKKLISRVEAQGFTIVPLSIYLKRGLAKLEIALAKGKAAPDKRQSIKDRDSEREVQKYMRGRR